MDLWVREGRILNYVSGVGTNFSQPLAKENASVVAALQRANEFPEDRDRAAGAIKAGALPVARQRWYVSTWTISEIVEFVNWKMEEEKKVGALIAARISVRYEDEAYRRGEWTELQ